MDAVGEVEVVVAAGVVPGKDAALRPQAKPLAKVEAAATGEAVTPAALAAQLL